MKNVEKLIKELNVPQNPIEKALEEPIMDIYRTGKSGTYSHYVDEYHKEIKELNENIRNIVKVWRADNCEPNMKLMANKIVIEEAHFSRFLSGQKDISLEKIDSVLEFVMREEFKKNNRQYLKDLQLTSESVREALNKWADDCYNPNFVRVAEKAGLAYPNLIQFKNNKTNLGKENLKKVYDFLKEQVYEN